MSPPAVSVIIPAYTGGAYLLDAVRSVLGQSYHDFELLVVDDRSPHDICELLEPISDVRLRIVAHRSNQGAIAARRTGVSASSGEIIAFLDEDDAFHPEKLATHVGFLGQHPAVGVTYNDRFEIDAETPAVTAIHSVRSIWQPPPAVTLADLVLGFPFSPSDTVLRRHWALQDDIWDQSYVRHDGEMIFNGGEIVFGGRLALAGASLANVGRALTYRRYHRHRAYKGLATRCRSERDCQALIFDDPRCPDDVRSLRSAAFANTYCVWAYYAFAQGDTSLGQSYVREALRLGAPHDRSAAIIDFVVNNVAADRAFDLEARLGEIFRQLPPDMSMSAPRLARAVAHGYLTRGTQAILFDRLAEGRACLRQAAVRGAALDERFVQGVTHQLLAHSREFGDEAADRAIDQLQPLLDRIDLAGGRRVKASHALNRAFAHYRAERYTSVPALVGVAVANNPRYLLNRGALSILLRSLIRAVRHDGGSA